jgi:serine/threonine protein phosphatase PrpC
MVSGSTGVAAPIWDGEVYWGRAGDSRLYTRDGAVLARHDHSMVRMVDWGMITAEEARVHPQRNQICASAASRTCFIWNPANRSRVIRRRACLAAMAYSR